jgi:hypothetical protein
MGKTSDVGLVAFPGLKIQTRGTRLSGKWAEDRYGVAIFARAAVRMRDEKSGETGH